MQHLSCNAACVRPLTRPPHPPTSPPPPTPTRTPRQHAVPQAPAFFTGSDVRIRDPDLDKMHFAVAYQVRAYCTVLYCTVLYCTLLW